MTSVVIDFGIRDGRKPTRVVITVITVIVIVIRRWGAEPLTGAENRAENYTQLLAYLYALPRTFRTRAGFLYPPFGTDTPEKL